MQGLRRTLDSHRSIHHDQEVAAATVALVASVVSRGLDQHRHRLALSGRWLGQGALHGLGLRHVTMRRHEGVRSAEVESRGCVVGDVTVNDRSHPACHHTFSATCHWVNSGNLSIATHKCIIADVYLA